jgi:hypothetical protein
MRIVWVGKMIIVDPKSISTFKPDQLSPLTPRLGRADEDLPF